MSTTWNEAITRADAAARRGDHLVSETWTALAREIRKGAGSGPPPSPDEYVVVSRTCGHDVPVVTIVHGTTKADADLTGLEWHHLNQTFCNIPFSPS